MAARSSAVWWPLYDEQGSSLSPRGGRTDALATAGCAGPLIRERLHDGAAAAAADGPALAVPPLCRHPRPGLRQRPGRRPCRHARLGPHLFPGARSLHVALTAGLSFPFHSGKPPPPPPQLCNREATRGGGLELHEGLCSFRPTIHVPLTHVPLTHFLTLTSTLALTLTLGDRSCRKGCGHFDRLARRCFPSPRRGGPASPTASSPGLPHLRTFPGAVAPTSTPHGRARRHRAARGCQGGVQEAPDGVWGVPPHAPRLGC